MEKAEAFERLDELLRRDHSSTGSHPSSMSVDQVWAWCEREKVKILWPDASRMAGLAQIPGPPKLLFAKGNLEVLDGFSIALVGTRRPSGYGIRSARWFSRELASRGIVIVSGLALGIDGAAHWGALDVGGKTVGVLGHGLDRIYPMSHRPLAQRILDSGGALITEYPPGVAPLKHHFPERNRIVAGLAAGVVVIEAPSRSGSLITVSHALDQGKDVFVVPYCYDAESYQGSHRLIQEGAKLITSVDDILSELGGQWSQRKGDSLEGDHPSLSGLKSLFDHHGGEVGLQTLFDDSSVGFATLMTQLEEARKLGLILEIHPQHYVWVKNPLHKSGNSGSQEASYSMPANSPLVTVNLQSSA